MPWTRTLALLAFVTAAHGAGCDRRDAGERRDDPRAAVRAAREELQRRQRAVDEARRELARRQAEVRREWEPLAARHGFEVQVAIDGAVVGTRPRKEVAGAPSPTDAQLREAVRERLAAHPELSRQALEIDAAGGLVTLRGRVASREQAARAIAAALEPPGVEQVVSYLDF